MHGVRKRPDTSPRPAYWQFIPNRMTAAPGTDLHPHLTIRLNEECISHGVPYMKAGRAGDRWHRSRILAAHSANDST